MATEHPDNERFFDEIQEWLGREIKVISSTRYATVDEVFMRRRYMSGPSGAICTVELKKVPRFDFQRPDDVHIFGYTVEEKKRISRFEANNPELSLEWILRDNGLSKQDCFYILQDAGIKLPAMYKLGFKNNNCIGCVKASSSKYWNMIRRHFPGVFEKRAKLSREIGARLVRYKGKRIFLDELPASADDGVLENVSCGPECGSETQAD
jgi:hypothetical protein